MAFGDFKPIFGEIARYLRTLVTLAHRQNETPITSSGTGTIPAGFKSISIVKTSSNADSVTITLSDTSVYTMTESGETFSDSATGSGALPAYTKGGAGTIKWHGLK